MDCRLSKKPGIIVLAGIPIKGYDLSFHFSWFLAGEMVRKRHNPHYLNPMFRQSPVGYISNSMQLGAAKRDPLRRGLCLV